MSDAKCAHRVERSIGYVASPVVDLGLQRVRIASFLPIRANEVVLRGGLKLIEHPAFHHKPTAERYAALVARCRFWRGRQWRRW